MANTFQRPAPLPAAPPMAAAPVSPLGEVLKMFMGMLMHSDAAGAAQAFTGATHQGIPGGPAAPAPHAHMLGQDPTSGFAPSPSGRSSTPPGMAAHKVAPAPSRGKPAAHKMPHDTPRHSPAPPPSKHQTPSSTDSRLMKAGNSRKRKGIMGGKPSAPPMGKNPTKQAALVSPGW